MKTRTVIVKLAPKEVMFEASFMDNNELIVLIDSNLTMYKEVFNRQYEEFYGDEEICESLFEISNSPFIDREIRLDCFGYNRSLSVGDIVEIEKISYICASFGWLKM